MQKWEMLHLSHVEKMQFKRKFPQIAPGVVEGECRQSTYSDMYVVGGVLYQICESGVLSDKLYHKCLLNLAEKCRWVCYFKRISAKQALQQLQENCVAQ